MVIGALIEILENIKERIGPNVNVEIYHDIRQSESIYSDPSTICTDDLKNVRVSEDSTKVYLSNEFIYTENYNDCSCSVIYDPETKKYVGIIIPLSDNREPVDDYDLSFMVDDKYKISAAFHDAVDKYINHLNNIIVSKTLKAVNKILKDDEKYAAQDDDSEYEIVKDEYIVSKEDEYYE